MDNACFYSCHKELLPIASASCPKRQLPPPLLLAHKDIRAVLQRSSTCLVIALRKLSDTLRLACKSSHYIQTLSSLMMFSHLFIYFFPDLLLTETWMKPGENYAFLEFLPFGYSFFHCPHLTGCGGGIAIVLQNNVKGRLLPIHLLLLKYSCLWLICLKRV